MSLCFDIRRDVYQNHWLDLQEAMNPRKIVSDEPDNLWSLGAATALETRGTQTRRIPPRRTKSSHTHRSLGERLGEVPVFRSCANFFYMIPHPDFQATLRVWNSLQRLIDEQVTRTLAQRSNIDVAQYNRAKGQSL